MRPPHLLIHPQVFVKHWSLVFCCFFFTSEREPCSISGFWPWRRDSWQRPQECVNLVSQIFWCNSVLVASVCSVFLMRMYAEREHTFGQKQVYHWPDWASLVVQLVKSLPAMRETWVWSWVGKIPWRRERLPTPVSWPAEIHGLYSPWGHKESDTTERLSFHFTSLHWPDCASWKDQYDIAYVFVSPSQGQLPDSLGVYPGLHHSNKAEVMSIIQRKGMKHVFPSVPFPHEFHDVISCL